MNPNKLKCCIWFPTISKFFKFWGLVLVCLLDTIFVFAQDVPEDPQAVNCNNPKTDSARYQCFIQNFNSVTARAEEAKTKKQDLEKTRKEIQEKKSQEQATQRQKKKDEIKRIAERSRLRNRSNEGKKYQVTYGRVLEPRR